MTRSCAPGCESFPKPLTCSPPAQILALTWLTMFSNIWSPLANVGIVKAIANKYKFSTRLQSSIIGWDEARRQVAEKLPKKPIRKIVRPVDARPKPRRTFHRPPDPERGAIDDGEASRRAAVAKDLGLDKLHQEDLHMYRLLQEQYNYTTIDHGSNCELIPSPARGEITRPD